MKGVFSVLILSLMILSVMGVASAVSSTSTTAIAGKIYNADYTETISGATVTITCNGNVETRTSLSDGAYSVTYDGSVCNEGDSLTVSAVKGDQYGSKTGVIHDNYPINGWNLGIVNVPLVPEFGVVVGALTIFSAVGIFFFVRKK